MTDIDDDAAFAEDERARIAALHKTAPEELWLQIDDEAERGKDAYVAQTWCEDKINETDVKYVRADLAFREVELWREPCNILRESVAIEIVYKRGEKLIQTRRLLPLAELDDSRFRNSYAVGLAARQMMDVLDAEMRRLMMPNR